MREIGPSLRFPTSTVQTRKLLAITALAAVLALAGCSGALSGGGGDDPGGDGSQASAENVTADAIAAIEDVDEYTFESNSTIVQTVNNVEQEQQEETTTRIDREDREVHVNSTFSASGQTLDIDIYLVNETQYERNEQYVRQFSSEWVKYDVSENFSDQWRQLDTLGYHRDLLDNGTTTLDGTDEVDGQDVHVLDLTANESALEEFTVPFQGDVSFESANVTYLIDQETGDVRRASGTITETITTPQGDEVDAETTFEIDFAYEESVDVTLPDAASDAVDLEEELQSE